MAKYFTLKISTCRETGAQLLGKAILSLLDPLFQIERYHLVNSNTIYVTNDNNILYNNYSTPENIWQKCKHTKELTVLKVVQYEE